MSYSLPNRAAGKLKHPVLINADDLRGSKDGFAVDVLVPVQKQARLLFPDVLVERREARMNPIVFGVNRWGGVSDENIHSRKIFQKGRDLVLLEQEISAWFVSPCASEAAERQSAKLDRPHVQV